MMEKGIDSLEVEIEDSLPLKGEMALYKNKVWRVSESYGNEIMHLQRPKFMEAVSLYGNQVQCVKKVRFKNDIN
jgi:hypothetical protein